MLKNHFFYNCPSFVVLTGDFDKGLSKGFAEKAAQEAKDAQEVQQKEAARKRKQIQREISPDELQFEHHPLPTAPTQPDYEPDSQTIIVDTDWVRAVEPMVVGVNQEAVILQFCDWHAAEAIKRKLIAKGYGKERRDDLINLMWAWIKAPDLDALEDTRDKFILNLNINKKEYLIS